MERCSRAMYPTHDLHVAGITLSRTHLYKKVTKPLLERKRRARINRCLEELKDLMMVGDLEANGENVSKLEKADILELTVRHLQNATKGTGNIDTFRFQDGFSRCAAEARNFLVQLPEVDSEVGQRLVSHLQMVVGPLTIQVPRYRLAFSPPVSPVSPTTSVSPSLQDLEQPHGLLMQVDTQTAPWRPW